MVASVGPGGRGGRVHVSLLPTPGSRSAFSFANILVLATSEDRFIFKF